MRRGEPETLETGDFLERFQQLDKWTFPTHGGEFMASVEIHDLTEQRDLLDPLVDEGFDLADNFLERPASFVTASVRDNAERAMHVAPLHNRDESGHLPFAEHMVPDGALGIRFFFDVHDRKPDIVQAARPIFVRSLDLRNRQPGEISGFRRPDQGEVLHPEASIRGFAPCIPENRRPPGDRERARAAFPSCQGPSVPPDRGRCRYSAKPRRPLPL